MRVISHPILMIHLLDMVVILQIHLYSFLFYHYLLRRKMHVLVFLHIVVKGELEVKLYNQNLDLGCRVKEITEWQYEDKTPKKEEVQVF